MRVAGAQARADVGDADSAVQRLKAAAADLQAKGKHSDALQLLSEAAMLDPGDAALRQTLVGAYVAAGDFDSACQFATTAAEFRRIAAALFEARRDDEGITCSPWLSRSIRQTGRFGPSWQTPCGERRFGRCTRRVGRQ